MLNNLRHIHIETFTHQIVKGLLLIWVVPLSSNSPHQDYYIFSGDPYKPSFATVTGWGDNPTYDGYLSSIFVCDLFRNHSVEASKVITSPKIRCIFADLDCFTHLIFLGSTVQNHVLYS